MVKSRFYIYLFISFFTYLNSYSQDATLDSLQIVLKNSAKEDTSYIKTLNALTAYYKNSQLENKYSLALNNYNRTINLASKIRYNDGLAKANYIIALMYEGLNKRDSTLSYYFNAVAAYEKDKNEASISVLHSNIARMYFYLGNLVESNKYTNLLINYYKKANKRAELGRAYMLKGVILQNMADSVKLANMYFKNAISITEELKPLAVGIMYNNYGEYLSDYLHAHADALNYFNKAKDVAIKTNDSSVTAYADFCIGKVYLKTKKYAEAKQAVLKAVDFWRPHKKVEDLLYAFQKLSDITYESGDFKSCVYYTRQEKKLKDSLDALYNSQNLNELQTKYDVAKKDKELSVLKEKSVLEQLENEKQKSRSLILLIGISVSILLGGFALYAYYKVQKANKLLDKEKKLVDRQKSILEAKNKEITDSIEYAKRIQTALMTNEKYIDKNLNRLTKES